MNFVARTSINRNNGNIVIHPSFATSSPSSSTTPLISIAIIYYHLLSPAFFLRGPTLPQTTIQCDVIFSIFLFAAVSILSHSTRVFCYSSSGHCGWTIITAQSLVVLGWRNYNLIEWMEWPNRWSPTINDICWYYYIDIRCGFIYDSFISIYSFSCGSAIKFVTTIVLELL